LILGPRCAPQFRRAAEKLERKNRTDHELPTPDKLTCYLQPALFMTVRRKFAWNRASGVGPEARGDRKNIFPLASCHLPLARLA